MTEIAHINNRAQLVELAKRLGVRHDWHEPDEQDVTACVFGESFDNAGFWGTINADSEFTGAYTSCRRDVRSDSLTRRGGR